MNNKVPYTKEAFIKVIATEPYFYEEMPQEYQSKNINAQACLDIYSQSFNLEPKLTIPETYNEYGMLFDTVIQSVLTFPVSLLPIEEASKFCDVIINAFVSGKDVDYEKFEFSKGITRADIVDSLYLVQTDILLPLENMTGYCNACAVLNWLDKTSDDELLKDGITPEIKTTIQNNISQTIKNYKRNLLEQLTPYINSFLNEGVNYTTDEIIEKNKLFDFSILLKKSIAEGKNINEILNPSRHSDNS